jgi:tetratricopeptide (TPR) repeat protein
MHVPLLLKQPRELNAGMSVNVQVMTVDIVPTVLELAGAAAPAKTDGESLMPYLTGANKNESPAFGETDYPLRFGWAPLRSVRGEGFKYIEAPRPEFYDLRSDPAELDNKYAPWNDRVRIARGQLAERRAKNPAPEVSQGMAEPETINELKALGYLGPADVGSATTAAQPSMLPDAKDKIEQQNLLHAAMLAGEADHVVEARKMLEKLLVLDPESPVALRQLGELELQAGDFDHAAGHLKAAVKLRPDDATSSFYEGKALAKLHDFAAARDSLETSLRLLPTQFPARLLLGEVYLWLKNPNSAEDEFEAALLLEPASVEAQLGLAKTNMAKGKFTEAARQLELLSRIEAKNPVVFETLAKAYEGLGEAAKANRASARAMLLREHTRR